MPIYKYKCKKCGLEVERFQDSTDEQLVWCPGDLKEDEECQGKDQTNTSLLTRTMGKPAAHFKGEGFYVNDVNDAENPASK
jgi:putative FmdB family regulatory protein